VRNDEHRCSFEDKRYRGNPKLIICRWVAESDLQTTGSGQILDGNGCPNGPMRCDADHPV
jgi:hypothetical protein